MRATNRKPSLRLQTDLTFLSGSRILIEMSIQTQVVALFFAMCCCMCMYRVPVLAALKRRSF